MASRGLFLTLEGVDGCGKTTQLELLISRLQATGRDPVRVQEPGGTRIGLEIRRILLDKANTDLDPTAELLLYFASRAQNIAEAIRPALARGQVVVADRFTDATMAYQGYGRGMGADVVRKIEAIACGGLRPDLTLWLDIDPEVGVNRALERNPSAKTDETRMEQEGREFYQRVYQGYQEIAEAEPERVARIDASGTIEQVADLIWAKVDAVL
ncbi:MAG: dTMP kinase [Acidobacteria bacterium]|nr:dTMP kinase [Acidobacteriota bacterium]MDA1237021.1 dTMP kinase [Acidobacteriota bacterium]